jgi:Tfp pilus assembly ATPase PilU
MVLLDQALINLYRKGTISSENLFAFCNDRDEVAKLVGKVEVQ